MVVALNGISSEEALNDGVLVESISDIRGPIMSYADLSVDGSVVALNASFRSSLPPPHFLFKADSAATPVELGGGNVSFSPEKYQIVQETLKRHPQHIPSVPFPPSREGEGEGEGKGVEEVEGQYDYPLVVEDSPSRPLVHRRARLVDISSRSCLCPNCHEEVISLTITEEERVRVREALILIARAASPLQERHLEDFEKWLKAREEFDFVVDGANIAYFNQNFASGKFSFKQV
jgi:hypothetical protein